MIIIPTLASRVKTFVRKISILSSMENYNLHGLTYFDRKHISHYLKPRPLKFERFSLDGTLHRTDGPAIIGYFRSGKIQSQYYYLFGLRHRIDGPGEIRYDPDGMILQELYQVNNEELPILKFINEMRNSNNKTDTLLQILNDKQVLLFKSKFTTILINMFKNNLDQNVINNLEIFI